MLCLITIFLQCNIVSSQEGSSVWTTQGVRDNDMPCHCFHPHTLRIGLCCLLSFTSCVLLVSLVSGGISMQCYYSNCETAGSGRTPTVLYSQKAVGQGEDQLYCNTLPPSSHLLLSAPSPQDISQSSSIMLGMIQRDLTRLTQGFHVILLSVCYSLLSLGFCLS